MNPTDLEPPGVEEELQQSEDGNVEIKVVTWVAPLRVQKLPSDQAGHEEGVHSQRHYLRTHIQRTRVI